MDQVQSPWQEANKQQVIKTKRKCIADGEQDGKSYCCL